MPVSDIIGTSCFYGLRLSKCYFLTLKLYGQLGQSFIDSHTKVRWTSFRCNDWQKKDCLCRKSVINTTGDILLKPLLVNLTVATIRKISNVYHMLIYQSCRKVGSLKPTLDFFFNEQIQYTVTVNLFLHSCNVFIIIKVLLPNLVKESELDWQQRSDQTAPKLCWTDLSWHYLIIFIHQVCHTECTDILRAVKTGAITLSVKRKM